MNTTKYYLIAVSFALLFVACLKPGPQGWTTTQRERFYNTSQGSHVIRYNWMLALEQPNNRELFLSDKHIESLRFLTRGFDPNHPDRPNHLPVGFVKDGNRNWLGFTCAACHTTELAYRGEKIRIEGGGTLADSDSFFEALTASVKNTYDQDDKFNRFADRVLGERHSASAGTKLQERLGIYKEVRENYALRNYSPVASGFARVDAFGRIYNKALHVVDPKGPMGTSANPPDAPVSYPFLWGTDQSDFVQWVGAASNANVGTLARNVGEVLGVFAHVEVEEQHFPLTGYRSSARVGNQIGLEQLVRDLQAPVWPEDVLPTIDQFKAGRGGRLFTHHCVKCHNRVDRTNVDRKVVAWMEKLDSIQTDPKTADNIVYRRGKTGILEGKPSGLKSGPVFPAEVPVSYIVTNIVTGMLFAHVGDLLLDEFISIREGRGGSGPPKQGNFLPDDPMNGKPNQSSLAYKGRSMTGVWATAPYLHNGSVPSLHQLLKRPDKRVKKFYVGSREFDPVEVGLDYKTETEFEFDTELPGNRNTGHDYGTGLSETEKEELIEYMKTDMGPY